MNSETLCRHCVQPDYVHERHAGQKCLHADTCFQPLEPVPKLCRHCAALDSEHPGGKCLFTPTRFEAFCCRNCNKPIQVMPGLRAEARHAIVREDKCSTHLDCLYAETEIASIV